MINNVVLVSGVEQSDSLIHINVSFLFKMFFPIITVILLQLLWNIEQSSLYYIVGPCWLSIFNTVYYYAHVNAKLPIYPLPFPLGEKQIPDG